MNNEKTKAVLAYLFGVIGGLIVLMMKDSERRTKICAAQSVTIFIAFFIVRFVFGFIPFNIPYLEYLINIIYLAAVVVGIVKACGDAEPEIPVIGDLATSIFKKQIEN